ncbi:MAG: GNAT family N-acetyltransferase [Chloroflexota bacterium]
MNIVYLADHPHHIPTVARWHHAAWGHLRHDDTLERRIKRLQGNMGHHEIPTVLIAIEGDAVLGSSSLIPHDMDTRLDLTPWLASVYTDEAHRGRGVGSAIVQRVMDEAKKLGVETLYLMTPDRQTFYERLGWVRVEDVEYLDEMVTIMQVSL